MFCSASERIVSFGIDDTDRIYTAYVHTIHAVHYITRVALALYGILSTLLRIGSVLWTIRPGALRSVCEMNARACG